MTYCCRWLAQCATWTFNWYASGPGKRSYCYTELNFSSTAVVVPISITHCILSLFNPSQYSFLWCGHTCLFAFIFFFESYQLLFPLWYAPSCLLTDLHLLFPFWYAPSCLVTDLPKKLFSLVMMSSFHSYLLLLTPVHHRQHHFHYASLLSSTPDSKLTLFP